MYYGAAAQLYTNHDIENLPADLSSVGDIEHSEISNVYSKTGEYDSNYYWSEALVVYDNAINLVIKFVAPKDAENLSVNARISGTTYNCLATKQEEDYFYGENLCRYEISLKLSNFQFDNSISLAILHGEEEKGQILNYNVNSYISSIYSADIDENYKTLLERIYCFGNSANAFWLTNLPLTITDEQGIVYTLSDDKTGYNVTDFKGTATDISIKSTINNLPVKSIGKRVFSDESSLYRIKIPSSIESIGNKAFSGCCSLEEVEIIDSVISIADYAFSECVMLSRISLPKSLKSIGKSVFEGCSLELITVDSNNETYRSENNYLTEKATNTLILGCSFSTIPEGIKSIGDRAFAGCYSLTNLETPKSVTSIGRSAFSGCYYLNKITIPNSILNMGDYMFSDCSSLESVVMENGLATVGNYMFSNCSSLTNIEMPDTITRIGEAFSYCSLLTEINLSKNLASIDYRAFSNCSSLKEIEIPNNVKDIKAWAFMGCSSLTSISLPNSIIEIQQEVFSGCTALKNVIMDNELTSIGSNAFFDCDSLTSIVIPISLSSVMTYAFEDCALSIVYYEGKEDDWANVAIAKGNDILKNATFYYYSESEPELNAEGTAYNGNYWHYVDGEVVVWEYVAR